MPTENGAARYGLRSLSETGTFPADKSQNKSSPRTLNARGYFRGDDSSVERSSCSDGCLEIVGELCMRAKFSSVQLYSRSKKLCIQLIDSYQCSMRVEFSCIISYELGHSVTETQ